MPFFDVSHFVSSFFSPFVLPQKSEERQNKWKCETQGISKTKIVISYMVFKNQIIKQTKSSAKREN
jgi:hypothetical protein